MIKDYKATDIDINDLHTNKDWDIIELNWKLDPAKAEEYFKQLKAAERVHNYLKDETFERKNNPFIGDFEDNYKYDSYFNDELDIL